MKNLWIIIFLLLSLSSFSQIPSVVFSRFIKDYPEPSIECTLSIYKQMPDSTFLVRTKEFIDQSKIALDPGFYILEYKYNNKRHINSITIDSYYSIIVINILEAPIQLYKFDFSNAIYLSPGMLNLFSDNEVIYIEF